MKALKVALVMPNHFDINSSLNNFIKTYQYLIKSKNVEVTLFTDMKNDVKVKSFKIQKINGLDYNTIFEKILFILGIPRFYYKGLAERLKGYDVITANNPEFYAYAYQAYKAAKKYNIRFVLRTSQTVEGFFLYKLTKYLINPIVKKAYGYASYLIFTNPQAEERCLKLCLIDNKKKSIITGHATDTKTFKPIKIKKSKKTVLLSVGGLYKIKGHGIIIKAFKSIIDKGHKNIELWIVGKGYYEDYLKNLANKLGIEKNVKFLGSKGHDELAKIYNMSDIFVLANYQEITPAVNEALACEKPVVVMECGGRDLVIPNENYGLVSRKFDMEDMAEKIVLLIKNQKLAAKIAENGRKRVLGNFSIKVVAEKFYKAFTQ
ncbi:glycosyltransferase family 4 protein [Candidatus Woesearchaeota archaeon]|nr:glycosyltransferase family 4 protein [Candidatus Woesearchaeota archaeon]